MCVFFSSKQEQKENPDIIINALQTYERTLKEKNGLKIMHGADSIDDLRNIGGSTNTAPSSPVSNDNIKFTDDEVYDSPLPTTNKVVRLIIIVRILRFLFFCH